jgi:hypothetical protein
VVVNYEKLYRIIEAERVWINPSTMIGFENTFNNGERRRNEKHYRPEKSITGRSGRLDRARSVD